MIYPYLGGRYGYEESLSAIGNAIKVFSNSGFQRTTEVIGPEKGKLEKETVRATPSLDNYDFDDPNLPADIKKYKILSQVASKYGQLNRSVTYDVLDMDAADSPLKKIGTVSGWLFHHGERANRQVAFIASYDLVLNDMRKKGRDIDDAAMEEAAMEAIKITERTNGGAIATGAPRFAQQGIGKVIFLFKRFGITMYYHLGRLAQDSVIGSDADKKIALKQLTGTFAGAGLVAGAQGLPLFGALAMVYDILFQDEEEDDFDTMIRKIIGEGFYGGLGNYIFGVDVASRMGLSDLIFRDRLIQKDQGTISLLIETLGGPVVGVYNNVERGVRQIADGEVARGIETASPAAIRNVIKSIRFANEGAKTLRGDTIIEDFGPGEVFGQFMGFAPARYTQQLQINASNVRKSRAAGEMRSRLTKKYYMAMREGDVAAMKKLNKKMAEYNKQFPQYPITNKSLRRSIEGHVRTTKRMEHGVVVNPRLRKALQRDAAEYDRSLTLWQDLGLVD